MAPYLRAAAAGAGNVAGILRGGRNFRALLLSYTRSSSNGDSSGGGGGEGVGHWRAEGGCSRGDPSVEGSVPLHFCPGEWTREMTGVVVGIHWRTSAGLGGACNGHTVIFAEDSVVCVASGLRLEGRHP